MKNWQLLCTYGWLLQVQSSYQMPFVSHVCYMANFLQTPCDDVEEKQKKVGL